MAAERRRRNSHHRRGEDAVIENLVQMYQSGAITADHLVVECLHRVDPQHPEQVLGILSAAVLERMLQYVREYRPGSMRTNYGQQPAADQVAAAKGWIESKAEELRLCV
jgi:hypothetical protein